MSAPATPAPAELLTPPSEVKDGFGWATVAGILFCGLVMMPGGIYLGLMTGSGIGGAASWVTVILFMEIARRALQPLSRRHLVVLLHAANVMLTGNLLFPGGPFGQLVFRAYLVTSDAVRDSGMSGAFPQWFVPPPTSRAILERNLLHHDFWQPILVLVFVSVVLVVQRYTLGYFFFRLTSDVEKLPFPLAPVSALGATALAEADADPEAPSPSAGDERRFRAPAPRKPSERWGAFTLGAGIGLAFGALSVAVPALSGLVLAKPIYPVPQPFVDTTTLSESILPATPTGATLDIAVLLLGMVLPLWTVIGTFLALVTTAVANPLLLRAGVLHTWRPGMDSVNTVFSNNLDFWLSFGIGAGLGVAFASLFGTIRSLRALGRPPGADGKPRPVSWRERWQPPRPGRGDYPLWLALGIYALVSVAVIALCLTLLPRSPGTIAFFVFFVLIYNPFIAYVNARLLGVSGQTVDIPFVRESAIVASGARGVDIWLAPMPLDTNSWQAQSYRVNELTGVSFWSLVKVELVTIPVLFLLSFAFWAFIWRTNPLPSSAFPWAQVNWELYAKNQVLLYSSTFVPPGSSLGAATSDFMRAIHPPVIAGGFIGSLLLFGLTTSLGVPLAFYYGVFRGLGQLPHTMVLELAGVLLARLWLWKRVGKDRFNRLVPILFAGYLTGVGLVAMGTIALRLIQSAVSASPF